MKICHKAVMTSSDGNGVWEKSVKGPRSGLGFGLTS